MRKVYLMLLRTRHAQTTIAVATIVDATNMGLLMTEGSSTTARQICAITKRLKSAPVVVTYAFMIWLLKNLRPTLRVTRSPAVAGAAGVNMVPDLHFTVSLPSHNDEVERSGAAATPSEGTLPKSSIS